MGFSFLLVRPIPVGERIIDLGPNWMEEGNTSTRQWGSLRIIPAACGNEMMLQLPARDPLLACVLSSYSRYFSTEGHVQEVGPCGIEVANLEHPSIIHLRALHNKPKEDATPKKTASTADSWYLGYDGVDIEYEEHSLRAQICLRQLFRECVHFERDGISKRTISKEAIKISQDESRLPQLRTSAVEWHNCDMEKLHEEFHGEDHPHRHVFQSLDATIPDNTDAESFIDQMSISQASRVQKSIDIPAEESQQLSDAFPLRSSSKMPRQRKDLAIWIGPPALDGVWKEPSAASVVDVLFEAVHSNMQRWDKKLQNPECRIARNCSAFWTNGTWKEHATDRQAAKFRCAPSFIIPGTQKGASTFLFHALSRHPQVVPPLRGAHGYKEAGAYVLQNCRRKDYQVMYSSYSSSACT